MTNEEFTSTVRPLHEARPFRPFVIEMIDGTILEVDASLAMGYRDGHFSVTTKGRGPRFFHCKDIRKIQYSALKQAAA